MNPLSFENIMKVADNWLSIGGNPNVEIGALEPLLWRDGNYYIDDVVKALVERGFKTSMTTNGQLLQSYAKKLHTAGLSLIRTSWHSTDPLIFKEISGGYGDYRKFISGVTQALELGIKVDFNRVLLKGFTSDIPEQLSLLNIYKSRLKLFTLLWTPSSDANYQSQYQDWRPVIKSEVLSRTIHIQRVRKDIGRERLRFHLAGGGLVEVKLGDKLDRSTEPCDSCDHKLVCEEKFGDYARVDPKLEMYFCYLRRDIGFSIPNYFDEGAKFKSAIRSKIGEIKIDNLLAKTSLRLTVVPRCNFNCRTPGQSEGWCMEEPGEYKYPPIKPTLVQLKR